MIIVVGYELLALSECFSSLCMYVCICLYICDSVSRPYASGTATIRKDFLKHGKGGRFGQYVFHSHPHRSSLALPAFPQFGSQMFPYKAAAICSANDTGDGLNGAQIVNQYLLQLFSLLYRIVPLFILYSSVIFLSFSVSLSAVRHCWSCDSLSVVG